MKKGLKKLRLSRETLGLLERNELNPIQGGTDNTTSYACVAPSCENCDPTNAGCYDNSWQHTCTCW